MGRARAGKSRRIREYLASRVHAGGKVLLIVPEQYSFESEKNLLDLLGATNQENVEILYTFTSLSNELLTKYRGSRRPPLLGSAKDIVMGLAVTELSHKLNIFDKCADNPAEIHELTRIIDEFSQNGVSFDSLTEAAGNSGDERLLTKARELSLLSDAYSLIAGETRTDTRYDLKECADIIAENRLFSDTTVFIDEFYGFTYPELEVIGSLIRCAQDVYITAVCESISTGYSTDSLAFPQNTVRQLLSLADRTGTECAEPEILRRENRYNSPALEAIEQNIFSAEEFVSYTGTDEDAVSVVSARSPQDECDYIASEAKRLVRETGIRYRDIAVIERGSCYSAYLPFSFKKYDIPVFKDSRRPLNTNPIFRFASSAVKLAAEGISTDDIFTLLKTDLYDAAQDDICQLENYAFVWDIRSLSWTKPFTRNPSGLGKRFSDEDKALLIRLNALRERIVGGIQDLRKELNNCDGEDQCKAVYEYLIQNGADKSLFRYAKNAPTEDAVFAKRSWDLLMDTLTLLSDIIGPRRLGARIFSSLFTIICSSSDSGEMPSGLDEIAIGSADRVRLTDKKIIFIAGANEGVFPAGEPGSFVLTNGEKRELTRAGMRLPQYGQANAQRERFLFYSAVSSATDRLYICYSRRNYSSGEMQPSDPVISIRGIIPNCTVIDTALLPPEHWIESRRSAILTAARHSRDDSVFSQTIQEYMYNSPDCDFYRYLILCGSKPETVFDDPDISKRLFEGIKTLTPTQIEKYYGCAFSYFCRYGMKVYPIEPAKYDNRANGTIIHAALENIFREYGSEKLVLLDNDQISQAANKAVTDYADAYIGKEQIDPRTKYSISQSVKTVTRMLTAISAELKESNFHTSGVEIKIGFGGDLPPYTIELPDGSLIHVGGTVDRVDVSDKGDSQYLRVLDYKTGNKEISLKDILSGINLQMPVYLFGLCDNNALFSHPLPAGVFYVPGSVTRPNLKRHDPDTEVYSELEDQNRLKGLIVRYPDLAEPDVYDATDTKSGHTVKTKTYRAVCVTKDQFDNLQRIVNQEISDMITSLRDGKIDACPLIITNKFEPCKYCDYKSVCRRETGDRKRIGFSGDEFESLDKGNL